MEPRSPLLLLLVLVLAACRRCGAQDAPNATVPARFACMVSTPCDTFVVYRTQSPGFLSLAGISDLFGVSRAMIVSANNLTAQVDGVLLPDQPLLVPVKCGCTGNSSLANVTYTVQSGDTYYALAVTAFENLTSFGLVQELNPQAPATKLKVLQEVTVPLFCRCPTPAERTDGIIQHITYLWRPVDGMTAVSKLMNASTRAIAEANNVTADFTSTAAMPMLIPVSQRPRLPPLQYSATTGDSGASKRSPAGITIAVSVAVSFVVFAALCVAVLAYRRYRRDDKATVRLGSSRFMSPGLCWNQKDFHSSSSSIARMIKGGGGGGGDKLLTSVSQFIDKPIIFGTEEIMEATMNLDERCRIGTSYYRAELDGEVFAVKPAKGDVSAEMRMTQMVNHASLIKLAGVSMGADGEYTFLVYEFAEKGSLDKWLYQKPPSSSGPVDTLSWNQRLGVAFDVANGLLYMHEHTQPSMVHGDVRARNILLTADFRAKICNFSVATPATVDAAATSSDVFAFGLLVLELLSGRRAVEARVGAEIGMLWRDIRAVLEAGDKRDAKLRKWMDPTLGGLYQLDAALSLAGMARACTEEDASRRPKMADVVFSLSMLVQPLPVGDAFEKLWQTSSEENIGIVNEVVAR